MNKTQKKFIIAALLLLTIAPATISEAQDSPNDILVIANNNVPIDSISVGELKAMFMKRRTTWKNGDKAVPIHARDNSPLRRAFQEKVLGMTAGKERLFWQNQKIEHGITPPPEFANTQKAVFSVRGSVSYVLRSDYKEGVTKVLLVIPN